MAAVFFKGEGLARYYGEYMQIHLHFARHIQTCQLNRKQPSTLRRIDV